MVIGYGHNEGIGKEERGSGMTWTGMWIEYEMGIDCLLGDMNGWIGDRVRACMTGSF